VDEEFNEFAIQQINTVDVLLFGRVTYELMAGYWPTPEAIVNDPIIAERMNNLPKIVFSKTLAAVTWQNTRLVAENAAEEIARLKGQPGKDLIIFGSSDLAVTLIERDLIDEFRIIVNPVVLGSGKLLFNGIQHPYHLELIGTKTFRSGNVLLYYQPDQTKPSQINKE
jgi:dihydrofolate reductase